VFFLVVFFLVLWTCFCGVGLTVPFSSAYCFETWSERVRCIVDERDRLAAFRENAATTVQKIARRYILVNDPNSILNVKRTLRAKHRLKVKNEEDRQRHHEMHVASIATENARRVKEEDYCQRCLETGEFYIFPNTIVLFPDNIS
jgi:hypothetical protein